MAQCDKCGQGFDRPHDCYDEGSCPRCETKWNIKRNLVYLAMFAVLGLAIYGLWSLVANTAEWLQ